MNVSYLRAMVGVGGLVVLAGCQGRSIEHVEATATVPVAVETAAIARLQSTIIATGMVSAGPGSELVIVAPAEARIAELPKSEGDAVKVGDLLVSFDIPSLAADVAAKHAAVAQAAARVDAAHAAFTRLSGLLAQGVASPRDVEDSKRQQAEAEADVVQAQSALDAAVSLANRATVRAPFAGVVAKRFHNPGDLVDASASDPVLKILNPSGLQVIAAVPVAQLSHVVVGHAAEIRAPGEDATEAATVVSRSPQLDATGATGDVRLVFRKGTSLASGTTVQVEIVGEEKPHALVIPAAALVTEEGEVFVMVAGDDNKAHKYPVAVGLSTRTTVEITNGIKAGDRVIVRGQEGLPEGALISIEAR